MKSYKKISLQNSSTIDGNIMLKLKHFFDLRNYFV